MKNAPPRIGDLEALMEENKKVMLLPGLADTGALPDFTQVEMSLLSDALNDDFYSTLAKRTDLTNKQKRLLMTRHINKIMRKKENLEAELARLVKLRDKTALSDPQTLPALERVDLWINPGPRTLVP